MRTKYYDSKNPRCNEEQYEILKRCSGLKDCSEWNEYRKKQQGGVWLQGADLIRADLDGADLTGAHLEGASLSEARLPGAWLEQAVLCEADLVNADLSGAYLGGANLHAANLENVNLHLSNLGGASIRYANLIGANLSRADLQNANLGESNFEGGNLSQSFLMKTCLYNVNLQGANLSGADLEGADLSWAHLEGATLVWANLKGAKLSGAVLKNVKMCDAYLKGADLSLAKFEGADLCESNLKYANLHLANLEGADLTEVHIEGAGLCYASLDKNTLLNNIYIDKNTDFRGVNLSACYIDHQILSALKSNVREKSWQDWYQKNTSYRTFFPKIFWWISDYGRSTKRVLSVFFYMAFLFSVFYAVLDVFYPNLFSQLTTQSIATRGIKSFENMWDVLLWYLQVLSFSLATMVTLGFGDINVAVDHSHKVVSIIATCGVAINLLTGYFLLSVLVTRLGILFQQLAPEYDFKERISKGGRLELFFWLAFPLCILMCVMSASVVN
jgi:Uncharacterized low-complexity proteins